MPYFGEPEGWGHVLQSHGIRVESVGKLHYRASEDPAGFDVEHLPVHVAGGHGMVWASIRDPYLAGREGPRMLGERIGSGDSPYTEYDGAVTQRTVEWLQDAGGRTDESWVLYVGLVAPHFPLLAPPRFFDLYKDLVLPEVKLHPSRGYQRHPWVQAYAEFERNEENFRDAEERRAAFLAYFGLCSWLDHNVGRILQALQESGLARDTLVIYTSDHGDNLGARGLWGKSTLYQESVCVPMILAGPGVAPGVCDTPVDLLDLFPTVLQGVGLDPTAAMSNRSGRSLLDLAAAPADPEREIFSEYHAAGSNTGGYMLRKGRWKYHHYVGMRPELFDLVTDPQELVDRAGDADCTDILLSMEAALRRVCDPEAIDSLAKADQRALIERHGGREAAARIGAKGATPIGNAAR